MAYERDHRRLRPPLQRKEPPMSTTLEVYAVPLTVLDDASSWEEIRARSTAPA